MQRFGGGAESGTVGAAEVLKRLEDEKQKRLERAAKFGTETEEMTQDKQKERRERFKIEGSNDEEKAKIAERKARFGAEGPSKEKRGVLEFTLDEYKSKKDKKGHPIKKQEQHP